MARFLLLEHYRGGPSPAPEGGELDGATPAEWRAHLEFMDALTAELQDSGEYVDAQALEVTGTFVRFGGEGAPPVTDDPFADTRDLIAGWWVVEVPSTARAHEIAARASSAPGVGGRPLCEWIEMRPLMRSAPVDFGEITSSLTGDA